APMPDLAGVDPDQVVMIRAPELVGARGAGGERPGSRRIIVARRGRDVPRPPAEEPPLAAPAPAPAEAPQPPPARARRAPVKKPVKDPWDMASKVARRIRAGADRTEPESRVDGRREPPRDPPPAASPAAGDGDAFISPASDSRTTSPEPDTTVRFAGVLPVPLAGSPPAAEEPASAAIASEATLKFASVLPLPVSITATEPEKPRIEPAVEFVRQAFGP